jgi:hypothetical protein
VTLGAASVANENLAPRAPTGNHRSGRSSFTFDWYQFEFLVERKLDRFEFLSRVDCCLRHDAGRASM